MDEGALWDLRRRILRQFRQFRCPAKCAFRDAPWASLIRSKRPVGQLRLKYPRCGDFITAFAQKLIPKAHNIAHGSTTIRLLNIIVSVSRNLGHKLGHLRLGFYQALLFWRIAATGITARRLPEKPPRNSRCYPFCNFRHCNWVCWHIDPRSLLVMSHEFPRQSDHAAYAKSNYSINHISTCHPLHDRR